MAFRLLSKGVRERRRLFPSWVAEDRTLPPPGDARTDVVRAPARQPVAQRQVVVSHYLFDLPVVHVAAELGVPVGTVKSRLSRGRAVLAPYSERTCPTMPDLHALLVDEATRVAPSDIPFFDEVRRRTRRHRRHRAWAPSPQGWPCAPSPRS